MSGGDDIGAEYVTFKNEVNHSDRDDEIREDHPPDLGEPVEATNELRKTIKFIVYVGEEFGDVRKVHIKFLYPKMEKPCSVQKNNPKVWEVEICHGFKWQKVRYKYYITDSKGKQHAEDIPSYYHFEESIDYRHISLEEYMNGVVHEGAALPTSWDVFTGWKVTEMLKGFCAMLPALADYSDCYQYCQLFNVVYTDVKRIPHQSDVFKKYIENLYKSHQKYINNEEKEWGVMLQRTIVLIWISSYQTQPPKNLEKLAESFTALTSMKAFNSLTLEHVASLLGPFETSDLVKLINVLSAHGKSDRWLHLIPFIHAVNQDRLKDGSKEDTTNPIWWGELPEFQDFKNNLKPLSGESCRPSSYYFRIWYGWLKPYFKMDQWAARTFLAFLSKNGFVKMMTENDSVSLPFDALTSCFAYHHPVSSDHVNDSLWLNLMSSLKSTPPNEPDSSFRISVRSLLNALDKYTNQSSRNEEQDRRNASLKTVKLILSVMDLREEMYDEKRELERRVKDILELCVHEVSGFKDVNPRIKGYESLLECSEQLHGISRWWESHLKDLFLTEFIQDTQLSGLLSMYKRTVSAKQLNDVIRGEISKKSDQLIMIDVDFKHFSHIEEELTNIVMDAVDKVFTMINQEELTPIQIANKLSGWKNFVVVYNKIKSSPDTYLNNNTTQFMTKVRTALREVVERLKTASVSSYELGMLKERKDDLLSLLNCDNELIDTGRENVEQYIDKATSIIEQLSNLKSAVRLFTTRFKRYSKTDELTMFVTKTIEWLDTDHQHLTLNELVDTDGVKNPELKSDFQQAALKYENMCKFSIFTHEFNRELEKEGGMKTRDDVVSAFSQASERRDSLLDQIKRENITVGELQDIKDAMFGSELNAMIVELQISGISEPTCKQIRISDGLETWVEGSEVIQKLRDKFSLTGDFENVDLFSTRTGVKLSQINEEGRRAAEFLKEFTHERNLCLTAICDHTDLIIWARAEIPGTETRTFIELAHSNLGDNDDMDTKIDALMDTLDGYYPMIYEMPSDIGFKQLMKICRRIWQNLHSRPDLPSLLKIAAKELDEWQALKENLDNFEIDTLSQATSINTTGIFNIGEITLHKTPEELAGSVYQELNDVIRLDCKLRRRAVDTDTENVAQDARFSATRVDPNSQDRFKDVKGSLEELQEKITLIAGNKQSENGEIIEEFNRIRDVAVKLGQTYLDLRNTGCILFDDLLIIFRCESGSTIPLELQFAGVDKPLCVVRKAGDTRAVFKYADDLHKFMTGCREEWRKSLHDARREHPILNHFTTEQLVTLRKQLPQLFRARNGDYSEAMQLVRTIQYNATKTELFEIGEKYDDKHKNENTIQSDGSDDDELDDLIEEIMKERNTVKREQCKYAITKLGDNQTIDEYIEFIEMQSRTANDTTISEEVFSMTEIETHNIITQLKDAWKRFLQMTSSTHPKLLSLKQLVYTLNRLNAMHQVGTERTRIIPDWLVKDRPNLVLCRKDIMYELVLSIYLHDVNAEKPTRSHILICTDSTTVEEVEIFMLRAVADSKSVYCLVNCERLGNPECRVIEDHREKGYTICFFCDEVVRNARVRSYFSHFSVKASHLADSKTKCEQYITDILHQDIAESPRALDSGLACRVILSDRAGAGKSLYCKRFSERFPMANYCIIPIYSRVDVNQIIKQLKERCKHDKPNIIHFDIAYEVEEGVDDFLMNLLVLGSICSTQGVVCHRNQPDYFLIECMPFKKAGKIAHHLLKLLPEQSCNVPTNDTHDLLDDAILKSPDWQKVLKYLQRYQTGDKQNGDDILDKQKAMSLLVRHCGLESPSWSEITYFIKFLSSQFHKIDTSIYCEDSPDNPLNGFREFVVKFMVIMAQDFATRSLKITEETPGMTINERLQNGGDTALDLLQIKRSWESSNHPYLFFNEDGHTFSFIGFVLSNQKNRDSTFDIIDPVTKQTMTSYPKFPSQLKAVFESKPYYLDLTTPFNNYPTQKMLNIMLEIMVNNPRIYISNHAAVSKDQLVVTDPDQTYQLTLDNVKKILAIHQRIRVGIPVIIMGDTGCGKTKLVDYASKLQVPEELRQKYGENDEKKIVNMITLKVHGGTKEEDIVKKVKQAEKIALENKEKCRDYARRRDWFERDKEGNKTGKLYNIPTVYTVLFLDEANTTEAIGLVKEILCDGRIMGEPLRSETGLKIVAACNPYKKHQRGMIDKLKGAGLGYFVDESETTEKFTGNIPMRHLVYKVHPLPQSLLPLVWDFGTLSDKVEEKFIEKMVERAGKQIGFEGRTSTVARIISDTHIFMRKQQDECSFVSLRDVDRMLIITKWFYKNINLLLPAESQQHKLTNSLLLAIGVGYLARLEDNTRHQYSKMISDRIIQLVKLDDRQTTIANGAHYFNEILLRCQDKIMDEVMKEATQVGAVSKQDAKNKSKHANIAKNKALKENIFMMVVCIENRIPLYLIGKPGSSKSLSKALVFDALVGTKAQSTLIRTFKQTYMVSFQCSHLATPNSIVSVFHEAAKRQQKRANNLEEFVSIVVLDEVGLAEDSKNMPLKTLHPLLEDGCESHEDPPTPNWKKCAFIGISNWALDPAKMNRGIFVQHGTPDADELTTIAAGLCEGADEAALVQVNQVLEYIVKGYRTICAKLKLPRRDLTEFFGLRDFYSLVKMMRRFAECSDSLTTTHLIHAIKRNFGGFDPKEMDSLKEFTQGFPAQWKDAAGGPPTMELVRSSITNDVMALKGLECRYLLVLTENLGMLNLILDQFGKSTRQIEIIFGSAFKRDNHFTQVCYNINLIKNCMANGTPVVLLNLDDLYESLYDTLNQYFSTLGDKRFVGLGLGTSRVKAFVHKDFRLVVIADSQKVYDTFPIPLINRLEKHYISMDALLTDQQREIKAQLENWAKNFVEPSVRERKCEFNCCGCGKEMLIPYVMPCMRHHIGQCCRDLIFDNKMERKCPKCQLEIPLNWKWEIEKAGKNNRDYFERSSVETEFVGYNDEMLAQIVIQATSARGQAETLEHAKQQLLQVATADSVLRVKRSALNDRHPSPVKKIHDIYFQYQKHDDLYGYIHQRIEQFNNSPPARCKKLFLQATTFASLLNQADVKEIDRRFKSSWSFNQACFTLNDLDTEAEFKEKIRVFYSCCGQYRCCLLILQCSSAHRETELLDAVRHLVQRESESVPDGHECLVITTIILNLPRGVPIRCYRGTPWSCVHIDDPGCTNLKTPPVSECRTCKPSDIIQIVITDHQSRRQQEETASSVIFSISVKSTIVPTIPKAMAAIRGHVQQSFCSIKDSILLNKDNAILHDVVSVWLEYTHDILKNLENKQENYDWVTSRAAQAVVMKHNETLRSSLETSLHEEVAPALAAVLAICEPCDNLTLLRDSITECTFDGHLAQLWLELMKACFAIKLNFKRISTAQGKLPEMFNTSGVLAERQRFTCKLPFSWIIYEYIEEIKDEYSQSKDPVDTERCFDESGIGKVFEEVFKIDTKTGGSFKDFCLINYLHDFVYLAHPCRSTEEHKLIYESIKVQIKDSQIDSVLSFHQFFDRHSDHYDNLFNVINVTLIWNIKNKDGIELSSAVCQDVIQKPDSLRIPCHLSTLMKALERVSRISIKELKANLKGYVTMITNLDGLFNDYILNMSGKDEEMISANDHDTFVKNRNKTLTIRHQLILRKIYIQQVILKENPVGIPSEGIDTVQLSNLTRAWKVSDDFKNFDHFFPVVVALQKSLVEKISKVFGCGKKCLKCNYLILSPTRLPCNHFVCLSCSSLPGLLCPDSNCKKQVTDAVRYDPMLDTKLSHGEVSALLKHRSLVNEFFMVFTSDIVFHCGFERRKYVEPSKEVIEWLVNCITSQNGNRTSKFDIFNYTDVIDDAPVVRSFLLKLLLHSALNHQPGEGHMAAEKLMEFINNPTDGVFSGLTAQTISLVVNCVKDHLLDTQPDESFHPRLNNCEIVTKLHLEHLQDVAWTQSGLEKTLKDILSSPPNEENLRLLSEHIERYGKVSQQPKYYCCQYIFQHSGNSGLLDIKNDERLSFILPSEVKNAISDQVEDHFLVGAKENYKDMISVVNHILDTDSVEGKTRFLQVADNRVMLQALFSPVLRYPNTHSPPQDGINRLIKLTEERYQPASSELKWCKSILGENNFHGMMNLKTAEGTHLAMLTIHMYTCVKGGTTISAPFSTIVNQIVQCSKLYLPIMPDNPLAAMKEVVEKELVEAQEKYRSYAAKTNVYSCPNGHIYTLGDCGNPIDTGKEEKCVECGARIGGQGFHELRDDNASVSNLSQFETSPGYILKSEIGHPVVERMLSKQSYSVMRCLLHISLLAAAVNNPQKVQELIRQPKINVAKHLMTQIKADLAYLAELLQTDRQKIMVLLHLIMNKMETCNTGAGFNLTTTTGRMEWEKDFDEKIIKPVFNEEAVKNAEDCQKMISAQTSHDSLGINLKPLIEPTPTLKEENWLDTSYMWIYKPPITLDYMHKLVSAQEKSLLNEFLTRDRELWIISYLPNVVKLMRKMAELDCQFTLKESHKTTIESFLTNQDREMKTLVEQYMNVWNVYAHLYNQGESDHKLHQPMIVHNSPLITILPIATSPNGHERVTYKALLNFLITDTHNKLIDDNQLSDQPTESERKDDAYIRGKVNVMQITQSQLVCLPNGKEDLLSIVLRHQQYEFGESSRREFEWEKIDEDIKHQYITGRTNIDVGSIKKLPIYHFPHEFKIINIISKLQDDQESIDRDDRTGIMQKLEEFSVNHLNKIVDQLETQIRLCSAIGQYDPTEKLLVALCRNFHAWPLMEWMTDSIEVKHLKSMWTLMKFLQAKAFMRNNQLAFDEVVPECRVQIDDCFKIGIRDIATYQSSKTHQLLEHLYEYIIFKLNNVSAREEMDFTQTLSHHMDFYLSEAYEDEHQIEGQLMLTNSENKQIPLSQATSTWEYLYHIYHTPTAAK